MSIAEREPYRPKFCRVRGCNLKFEHDGEHAQTVKHRRGVAVVREEKPRGRGSSLLPLRLRGSVRHVNANPRGHLARLHMAEIRGGKSPEPLPTVKAVSRRQQILARRATS